MTLSNSSYRPVFKFKVQGPLSLSSVFRELANSHAGQPKEARRS